MMKFISLFCALFFCLTGCGYHFPGQGGALPEGVEKVYIPLFNNKTSEPQLESKLTSRLSEVFSRNSRITQVKNKEAAEAVLEGTIRTYKSSALSYDQNDNIGEYRATMVIDVVLHKPDSDESLWKRTVSWSEDYSSSSNKSDQYGLEKVAIDEISLRLAEEILYQLLDAF